MARWVTGSSLNHVSSALMCGIHSSGGRTTTSTRRVGRLRRGGENVESLGLRLRKFRNSRLIGSRRLFRAVTSESDFASVLALTEPRPGSAGSLTAPPGYRRVIRRLRPWFWPYLGDAEVWASATEDTWFDPTAYLRDEPRRLLHRLIKVTPPSDSVLDIGCNSGADLNLLREVGFQRLYGVDAGGRALQLFAETYPETYAMAEVTHDLFQHYLMMAPDGLVDVVHSNGATIELVHPSFPIIAEICRVTGKSVFLDVLELGHAYPRDYISEFQRHGFRLVYCERDSALYFSSLLQFDRIPP